MTVETERLIKAEMLAKTNAKQLESLRCIQHEEVINRMDERLKSVEEKVNSIDTKLDTLLATNGNGTLLKQIGGGGAAGGVVLLLYIIASSQGLI